MQNIYSKHHLVPFGEYIPFKKWIPLETVTNFSGFVAGEGPRTFKTPEGLSYTPLICYEAIFSGLTPRDKNQRPNFIINVTNDAWYGFSAGPYQHLAQTRFRAVEEGLPLIRAANTGISGIIDPYGLVHERTETFVATTFVGTVELGRRPTFYTRFGDWIVVVCGIALVGFLAWALVKGRSDEFLEEA